MKIETTNPIKTDETKSQRSYPSAYKIITAVALTAIAIVVYTISSQHPKTLITSNDDVRKILPESDLEAFDRAYPQRNLAERTQFAASVPLCTRAINETTLGEYAPTNVWINKHHNHCACHVTEDQLKEQLVACTYISDKEMSTLQSAGVNLDAAPFQYDLTTNEVKACFQVLPKRNLRTDS